MDRIPFGIRQLDTIIDGGAPPGNVVLLSGQAGAGSREFMYTSAIINGLANANPELHDLYYGDVATAASASTSNSPTRNAATAIPARVTVMTHEIAALTRASRTNHSSGSCRLMICPGRRAAAHAATPELIAYSTRRPKYECSRSGHLRPGHVP